MTLEKGGLGFLSCYQWHMTVVTDSQQYSNWINLKKQQTSMWNLGGGWAATYLQKGCHWTVFLPRDSLWLLNTFKPVVEGLNTPEVRSLRPFPSCAFFSLLELHLSSYFFEALWERVGILIPFIRIAQKQENPHRDTGSFFCCLWKVKTWEVTQDTGTAVEEEGYGNKGDSDTLI